MKFKTIASGSKGNCYILETDRGSLLLEAGIPINQIKKALEFDYSDIQGCLITHEHGDHAKAIKDVARLGIDVHASKGTLNALSCEGYRFIPIGHGEHERVRNFDIMGISVEHDAAEPLGFLIRQGKNKILFATDTYYLKYKFRGLTHIAIECNYSERILKERAANKEIDIKHAERVIKSHMSLENLLVFLKSNDLSKVQEIYLLHLSDDNSDATLIEREVRNLTSKKVAVC